MPWHAALPDAVIFHAYIDIVAPTASDRPTVSLLVSDDVGPSIGTDAEGRFQSGQHALDGLQHDEVALNARDADDRRTLAIASSPLLA